MIPLNQHVSEDTDYSVLKYFGLWKLKIYLIYIKYIICVDAAPLVS